MACFSGPESVNDGLIFNYDMNNTQKSFRGMPTTNLATSQTLSNHSLVTLPIFSEALERGLGWKKVIVTATSGNFRMLQMPLFSVAANSTTTYSIEFECSSPEVYLNIDGTGFGGGAWTKIGPTRYSRTVTTATAGTAYLFVNSNNLNASVNYVIYYKEYQIEANAFATPYVSGTRSNTQAIVDLTGRNTVIAASLTYSSDNTFSFDGGVNNAIDCGGDPIIKPTAGITVSTWIKFNGAAADNRILSDWHQASQLGDRWIFYTPNSTSVVWYMTSNGQVEGGTPGYTFNIGQWVNLTGTYNQLQQILYVNGVQHSSISRTGTLYAGNSSQTVRIGRQATMGSAHNGSISNVQIYNRALSATEVQQNFNALRGRYGI